jgi:hypothetical protein
MAAGLVYALPVQTRSVACPPAHEGRVNCLIQHAWAPAFVKVAAAMLIAWLVGDLLLHRLPAARIRWQRGERPVRRATDRGRGAVLADPVLAAANWGILPEPGKAVAWTAASREEPVVVAAVAEPVPAAPPRDPDALCGLDEAARRARPHATLAGRLRILESEDVRTRKLRRGSDPALVVSCWSDLTAAQELPDGVGAAV